MGRLTVHFVAQRAIGFPLNTCVKEGKVAVSFRLHGEHCSGGQGSPSDFRVCVVR
jgi:hypothetical protein